jgi:hypothetical protein
MPVMPSPVPRPVGAARQGRVPLIASAGAAVLAAALWWGIALQAPPQAAAASATTEDAAQAAAPTTAEPGLAGPQADAMPRADEPPAVEPSRAAAATRRVVNRSAAVTDPRQVCGSRRFIAFVACVKRECERPELSQHPECRRMAALEGPEPQP